MGSMSVRPTAMPLTGEHGVEQGAVDEELGTGGIEDASDHPHPGGHHVSVGVLRITTP